MDDREKNGLNSEIIRLKNSFQEKISLGKERLLYANNDPDKFGNVLISYHGALEDHIRASLVTKVPEDKRTEILDMSITNWKYLLIYGRDYLGLSQGDADLITEANHYRANFGHGQAFSWSYEKLISYTNFVQNWCAREIQLFSDQPFTGSLDQQPSMKSTPVGQTNTYTSDIERPWYRSTPFLWFTFFFVFPVWCVLILTEKMEVVV